MLKEKNRLSKILAAAGVASRRACEKLIFEGHVSVNGETILLPQHHVSSEDLILVKGEPIETEKKVYYLLNKPKGFQCTAKEGVRRVIDLFPPEKRLFTVGRLDKATTGLLIVTNDGHFANRVIHPSSQVQKEYVAKTNQELTDLHLQKISRGTYVEGTFVKPHSVKKMRRNTVKIIVMEGKKHEVRRLIASAGLKTLALERTRVGNLRLGNLPLGHYRPLTQADRNAIFIQA